MAHQVAKIDLLSKQFPFKANELAAAVYIAQFGKESELEQPHVFFMRNVLPVQRGIASVHFAQVVNQHTYPKYLDQIFIIRSGAKTALFSPASGQNFIYDGAVAAWVSYPFVSDTDAQVSVAHLKGQSYIFYAGVGLYIYDFDLQDFVAQTITGGPITADILGVTACGAYLVLYTAQRIYYSDPLDPLLFTPVLGGPGSSGILANRSEIICVLEVADGIIVYTTINAIYGALTNNANIPFRFSEISQSAGVAVPEHVSYDGTASYHIAWTTSGFMQVSPKGAELIWPELSDMIAQGVICTLGSNLTPQLTQYDSVQVKLTSIGSRYLAISLKNAVNSGVEYKTAFVYDIGLERWGRIDIPHIDIFEYRAPEFVRALTIDQLVQTIDEYTQSIDDLRVSVGTKTASFGTTFGVVGKLGSVHIALSPDSYNVDLLENPNSGALTPAVLVGKYQLVRPRGLVSHTLQVTASAVSSITATAIGNDAAGDLLVSAVMEPDELQEFRWHGSVVGASLAFCLSGKMNVTSGQFEFTLIGGSQLPTKYTGDETSLPEGVVYVGDTPVVVGEEYVVTT